MNKDQAKAEDLKRQQMEVGGTLKPGHRPAAASPDVRHARAVHSEGRIAHTDVLLS